jgi:hypothetical protein
MTRRHVLTQMERLADRLQADHSPYTPEDANRLRELRGTLSVLEGKAMKPTFKGCLQRIDISGEF